MNINIKNGIAIVQSNEILISDIRSALDFMATVQYESNCNSIIINKENVIEECFNLSNGIFGEILQKFVNYNVRLAIIGDYSIYTSKALRDFIYESNNGKHIYFVETEDEGLNKLL